MRRLKTSAVWRTGLLSGRGKPNGPAAMASLDATGTGKPCCGWRTGRNCLLCWQLCADLDGEFEEFCEDDDYYEPVVEDYDFEYDMKQICPRYGLEAFDITYEGSDEGFEPYCGKGRW